MVGPHGGAGKRLLYWFHNKLDLFLLRCHQIVFSVFPLGRSALFALFGITYKDYHPYRGWAQ